jgi:hypothetical protein
MRTVLILPEVGLASTFSLLGPIRVLSQVGLIRNLALSTSGVTHNFR